MTATISHLRPWVPELAFSDRLRVVRRQHAKNLERKLTVRQFSEILEMWRRTCWPACSDLTSWARAHGGAAVGGIMRRIILAAGIVLGVLIGAACTPTASLTATPSTTAPACKAVTTVTGKLTPKDGNREVTLQKQRTSDGKWESWMWFTDGDDPLGVIQAQINKTTGAYSLTYLAPQLTSPATTRLRMKTTVNGADVVSKSWYVTRPSPC